MYTGKDDADGGFGNYLKRIARLPELDRDEELELARRYRAGDSRAGEQLLEAHLRDVVKIVRGYRGYGHRLSELVGEGNVGLVRALERFEPDRGLRFMTYAAYWVRAHVLEFILKSWSLVAVGTSPMQSKLFFRLQRERSRLAAEYGDAADLSTMLAERFGCSRERIRRMEQRLDGRDLSLDMPAYADGATNMVEQLRGHDDLEACCAAAEVAEQLQARLERVMAELDVRERAIVEHRLIANDQLTLTELGTLLGISRERVRQLESRVKAKLRLRLVDLADPEHGRWIGYAS